MIFFNAKYLLFSWKPQNVRNVKKLKVVLWVAKRDFVYKS